MNLPRSGSRAHRVVAQGLDMVRDRLQRAANLVDSASARRSGRRATLRSVPCRPNGPRLDPATALRENGFTVFRALVPADECALLAATLKTEAGIRSGEKYTKVDATNSFAAARDLVLDERILGAVRSAIGAGARFLQVSDLHYLHDTGPRLDVRVDDLEVQTGSACGSAGVKVFTDRAADDVGDAGSIARGA